MTVSHIVYLPNFIIKYVHMSNWRPNSQIKIQCQNFHNKRVISAKQCDKFTAMKETKWNNKQNFQFLPLSLLLWIHHLSVIEEHMKNWSRPLDILVVFKPIPWQEWLVNAFVYDSTIEIENQSCLALKKTTRNLLENMLHSFYSQSTMSTIYICH